MSNTKITNQQMEQQLHQATQNLHIISSDLLLLFIMISIPVYIILFSCSLQKTMSKVPVEKRMFPNWFIWMRLVPIAGLIFEWLMLPFGIPAGLRNVVSGNKEALTEASRLKMVGLALLFFETFVLSFQFQEGRELLDTLPEVAHSIAALSLMIMPALSIIYWIKIVSFRKKYLE